MNVLLNLCCGACLAFVTALAANGIGLTSFGASANPRSGEVKRAVFTREIEPFNSHAKAKVVQYFDTYQNDPMGLPEKCASRIRQEGIPEGWVNGGFLRGTVIRDEERKSLVEIPTELLRVLPSAEDAVHYYLAGSHLVAVDAEFRVLDSVPIPTIRPGDRAASADRIEIVRHISPAARRN